MLKRSTGGDTGKRGLVEVSFHSLRHTFVSLCRENNAPLSVVEAIVGHSNPAMTRHYTHVSEASAGLTVSSLPNILSERSEESGEPVLIDGEVIRRLAERLNTRNASEIKKELLRLVS